MRRAREYVAGALVALAAFTAFDHGMKLDQAGLCARSDTVSCPRKLWWFARECETDSECAAVTGGELIGWSPPARLIGHGCDGATGDLRKNEEDEFPRCDSIEEADLAYWQLERDTANGNKYVDDFNLSLDDCAKAAMALAPTTKDEVLCAVQTRVMRKGT